MLVVDHIRSSGKRDLQPGIYAMRASRLLIISSGLSFDHHVKRI
jgi:hypothetical protein